MATSLRARQTAETRQELIKAGTLLFGSQGYGNVSAVSIVEAAGVTRGALYHHFEDGKAGLFAAVVEDLQAVIVNALEAAYDPSKPTKEILRSVVEGYFQIYENKAFRQILLQDAPSVLGWRPLREIDKKYSLKFLRERLLELQARGEIVALPVDMLATALIAASCETCLTMSEAKGKAKANAKKEAILVVTTLTNSLLP